MSDSYVGKRKKEETRKEKGGKTKDGGGKIEKCRIYVVIRFVRAQTLFAYGLQCKVP